MPSQLDNIGLALQGFGAGVQGQLPQFMQAQNQQQGLQLEAQNRQQDMAMRQQQMGLQTQEFQQKQQEAQQKIYEQIVQESAKDVQMYHSFMSSGNAQAAEALTKSFMDHAIGLKSKGISIPDDMIKQAGELNLLARASMSKDHPDEAEEAKGHAISQAKNLIKGFQDAGILEKPKAVSKENINEAGQIPMMDSSGNVTLTQVPGWQADDKGTKEAIQAVNSETGEIIPLQYDTKGKGLLDMKGNPATVPQGFTLTRLGAPQGAMEGLIPKTADVELKKRAGSVASFNETAQQVADIIKSNPDANTFVASAASLANTAKAEAKAIGRHLGIDTDVYTPSSYNETFRELGIKSDVLKSLYTSLAFQAAAASGQSGKEVSNKDVERFLKQVGGGGSDPASVIRVLQATTDTINNSFDKEYKQFSKGKSYPQDLSRPKFPDFGKKDGEWEIMK